MFHFLCNYLYLDVSSTVKMKSGWFGGKGKKMAGRKVLKVRMRMGKKCGATGREKSSWVYNKFNLLDSSGIVGWGGKEWTLNTKQQSKGQP